MCNPPQFRCADRLAEQTEKDIESSAAEVEEAKAAAGKTGNKLESITAELAKTQVGCATSLFPITRACIDYTFHTKKVHEKAEAKLKKERAELTRFDDELAELEKAIKEKRQAMSDADLAIQEAEHQIQTLQKERTAAINAVANLEKQFPWIVEEKK